MPTSTTPLHAPCRDPRVRGLVLDALARIADDIIALTQLRLARPEHADTLQRAAQRTASMAHQRARDAWGAPPLRP